MVQHDLLPTEQRSFAGDFLKDNGHFLYFIFGLRIFDSDSCPALFLV